jgi:hypothetical protein
MHQNSTVGKTPVENKKISTVANHTMVVPLPGDRKYTHVYICVMNVGMQQSEKVEILVCQHIHC